MFRGDLAELAALMRRSWAENAREPLEYSEALLRSVLSQPGAGFALCPAVYEGGDLVGFGAAVPRTVRMAHGTVCRLLLDSFITVAPEQKGRGLGRAIWAAFSDVGRERGDDGLVTFCVEGDRMNGSLLRYARECSLPTVKSVAVGYLARPVPRGDGGEPGFADAAVLTRFAPQQISMARVWTTAEAVWQCSEREGSFGARLGDGTIAAYAMRTAAATPTVCGLVDDVVWGSLDAEGQKRLIEALYTSARAAGVQVLLVPVLDYADLQPFRAAGFRKTARSLQMYLTPWSERFHAEDVRSVYIDVL